jgi:hypothetical protein
MKLLRTFTRTRKSLTQQQAMIQEMRAFLLEPDERRFSQLFLARLLDEGCNLPLAIALPRLYDLMVTNLLTHVPASAQQQFQAMYGNTPCPDHRGFVERMTFCAAHLKKAGKCLAHEFLNSLDTLKTEWQGEIRILRQDASQFEQRLLVLMNTLCPQQHVSIHDVRRRIYIAITTSLLRHFREPHVFHETFGSVPQALRNMQQDHNEFIRCLELYQQKIPYFPHVVAQVFWRTLETLRLEMCDDAHRHAQKDSNSPD